MRDGLFAGTPEFAVPCLKHFLTLKDFEIAAVLFTQPDRPQGAPREGNRAATGKENCVGGRGFPVHQPEKDSRAGGGRRFCARLRLRAIAIYRRSMGRSSRRGFWIIPRLGWINLHASLLPKYRGSAPIQWAICERRDKRPAWTTMRIDAGMDTGEIAFAGGRLAIGAKETTPEIVGRGSRRRGATPDGERRFEGWRMGH